MELCCGGKMAPRVAHQGTAEDTGRALPCRSRCLGAPGPERYSRILCVCARAKLLAGVTLRHIAYTAPSTLVRYCVLRLCRATEETVAMVCIDAVKQPTRLRSTESVDVHVVVKCTDSMRHRRRYPI